MIDLAVSDMLMDCVTHGMGFARTVAPVGVRGG